MVQAADIDVTLATDQARVAHAPVGSASTRQAAVIALVFLCVSYAITAGVFIIAALVASEHDTVGVLLELASVLAFVTVWAAVVAFALALLVRLTAPSPGDRLSLAWSVLLAFLFGAAVATHLYFREVLDKFFTYDEIWTLAVWLVPTLLSAALGVQVVRMLVLANRSEVQPRGLRLLLWTAFAETATFVLLNGLLAFVMLVGLALGASGAD